MDVAFFCDGDQQQQLTRLQSRTDEPVRVVRHVSPSTDEYVGRSPKGMRAGLGAARRSARVGNLGFSLIRNPIWVAAK
jgi:hypothetical protein